ncbi:GNAT family N-acetyltransferase [Lacibacterium aquatile]|uniref:GNAT family N-acetyltransferase n=1 Tax=Lacibacterium aquatile TaxID=1168082 RepID=A0ABW5DX84_9PROT
MAALGNLGGRSLLALEQVQLASWPARRTVLLDGWAIRLSSGVTNRSTSINALTEGRMPLSARLTEAVALFRAAGRCPVARITPLAEPALDPVLDRLGWERLAETDVQVADLSAARPDAGVALVPVAEPSWIGALAHGGASPERIAEHRELLGLSRVLSAYAYIGPAEAPLALGLGTLENGVLMLHEIATAPQVRRQGLSDRLCRALMAWGQERGATTALLQVVASNAPAHALYARLGFSHAYSYWYRRAPC